MTTALATLLCDSDEHGIVNGLRITARHCALNGIHARFHVFDDADDQREALFTPARWIVWDRRRRALGTAEDGVEGHITETIGVVVRGLHLPGWALDPAPARGYADSVGAREQP